MSILIVSNYREHFESALKEAEAELKIMVLPSIRQYLLDLLEFHVETRNLFPQGESTLAEAWLRALDSTELQEKRERLKLLGDRALYISGFFSESFERKIIDIDYYIQMGELAFSELAEMTKVETHSYLYRVLAKKFNHWVDVLAFVASRSAMNSDSGLLRLYEKYLKTGSELAYQQLLQKGVVSPSKDQLKKAHQDE